MRLRDKVPKELNKHLKENGKQLNKHEFDSLANDVREFVIRNLKGKHGINITKENIYLYKSGKPVTKEDRKAIDTIIDLQCQYFLEYVEKSTLIRLTDKIESLCRKYMEFAKLKLDEDTFNNLTKSAESFLTRGIKGEYGITIMSEHIYLDEMGEPVSEDKKEIIGRVLDLQCQYSFIYLKRELEKKKREKNKI